MTAHHSANGIASTPLSCDPTSNGFTLTESYVLGPGGEELSMLDGSNQWQRTNVYAAGKLVGTYDLIAGLPALHFQIADPLGSRRVQTDSIGWPEEQFTNWPFGDELVPSTAPNAPPSGGDDATPLHFTGKERDSESGNDYFGARYYASTMGRFLSPDWSAKEEPVPYAKLDDPQSLNLYGYIRNNPFASVDPDGHNCNGWCDLEGNPYQTESQIATEQAAAQNAQRPAQVQQQGGSSWTSVKPTSGDYVAYSDWPNSAGGFHPAGLAVDSDDTHGFSTANPATPWWKRLFGAPKARMEDDIDMHTNSAGEAAKHSYLYHSITAKQADDTRAAMNDRTANAGRYNLLFNNCAQAVESFLHAEQVPGVPHGEVSFPFVLHDVLLLERGSQ